MLNTSQTVDKLYGLSKQFYINMYQKKWPEAKYCYDTALTVSVFIGLDERSMIELFGSRDDPDHPIIGMFREADVQRVYWECIKRDQTSENAPYKPPKFK